jgi:MoaA/NifB/PqqE/SkfB family radical SAM enzyme
MRCRYNENFKNGIAGWLFEKSDIMKTYDDNKILMLDVEYGTNCRLNCSYCFRRNDPRDGARQEELSKANIIEIARQAQELGAKSIHFVGKGESLEQPDFPDIVHQIGKDMNMIPLIFTAGHVLGDDRLAKEIHHGKTGDEIIKDLYDSNASIILKINSLNHQIQNKVVNTKKLEYKAVGERIFNYTKYRDIALERLMKAGFNSWENNPTRLGTATVMLKSNYHELFHHYRYFRSLNIYPIINTVVPCGRTKDTAEVKKINPTQIEKLDLWKKIYEFNIENGIKYEGISSYVGGHICSQLGYAMYINVYGEVYDCPSSTHTALGNFKLNGNNDKKLEILWNKSPCRIDYKGGLDNGCPWRFSNSAMIPKSLFRKVHEHLKEKYPDDQNVQNFVPPKHYG